MKNYLSSIRRHILWILVIGSLTGAIGLAQIMSKRSFNDIGGVPSLVSYKYGSKQYARSERNYRVQRIARTNRRRKYRNHVHKEYGFVVASWHSGFSRGGENARRVALQRAKERRKKAQRIALAKAKSVKAAQIRLAAIREAAAKREAARLAALQSKEAKKAAILVDLAIQEEKQLKMAEAASESRGARQNLTLAFVNPRREPVSGLKLTARVQTPSGTLKTLSDLETDANGRVKLAALELPAVIDFDIVGSNEKTPYNQDREAGIAKNEAVEPLSEWDFAKAESSTLLVSMPLGKARIARLSPQVPNRSQRFSSTRLVFGLWTQSSAAIKPIKIYDGAPSPIIVERNVVDVEVSAPAGSVLSTPALQDQDLTVPESGKMALRLPRAALSEGAIPIRVARDTPGGESESVISTYPTDAYQTNAVAAPPLRLVRVSTVDMAGRLGVMGTRADVVRVLGDLKGKANKKNQIGKIAPMADGSEWWIYPAQGIAFKMRLAPEATPKDKNAAMLIERVRVFNDKGGALGGVKVGSTLEEVRANLGTPQEEDQAKTLSDALSPAGQIDTWIDGGLRICHDDAKVLWMETARPDALLLAGTTAFVQRPKARLFIESFVGHAKTNLIDINDLRRYLQQVHSVTLVDSRDEADLVLSARVSEFYEDKDEITDLIPYRYDCRTKLRYSLFDTAENRFIVQDKEAVGVAKADYSKEAILVGVGGAVLLKKGGLLGDVLGGVLIGGGISELHRAMKKAANRCPAISARTAFNTMVGDINQASDFSVRVTDIDYMRGTLLLNAGSAEGLRASQSGAPVEFQIAVAGVALPTEDSAKSADYYAARVVSVDEHSSVCQLFHVNRRVKKIKESFKEEAAPEMLRQLPEAATGLISARAWVQFPEVTVISDADIARAQAAQEEREREAEKAARSQQQ